MEWIDINDELPELIEDENGNVNCVLIWYKVAPECSFNADVSNVAYFLKNKDSFTHWAHIPDAPKKDS